MTSDAEAPLLVDNLKNNRGLKSHWRDTFILSSSFLLIFLAYGAAQNLETTVNSEADLGTISLGILYTSFTFFSLVASVVVRALGSKNALILGTTGYWLFIAANLLPSWYTMVPASFYLGFCSSILWVGQGTYLTLTALSYAENCHSEESTIVGKFNGVFWGFYASNQFVGNVITLGILSNGKAGGSSGTTLLFIVFLCSMTLGTILMCFLTKRDSKGDEDPIDSSVSLCSSIISLSKSVIAPLLDVKILLLIPVTAYTGFQSAFVWAEFTKQIVTPALGLSGVGGAMAVFGIFDTVCSLVAGRLTSGLSSIACIIYSGCLLQAIIFIWILWKYSVASGVLAVVYPLLMAAILGTSNASINIPLNALLGLLFKHDMEGAFAQFKVWHSAATAVVFFIYPYISLQAMVIIMLVALCISVAGVFILTLNVEKVTSSPSS